MKPTIKVAGVEITDDVDLRSATFTSQANGAPGPFSMLVRDKVHTKGPFPTGSVVTVDLGATRIWRGFLRKTYRQFPFPAQPTPDFARETPRYWRLEGTDINILLQKRIVRDIARPTFADFGNIQPATFDDTAIIDLFTNYVDLAADGVTTAGVHRIGLAVFDVPGLTSGKGLPRGSSFNVARPGFTFKDSLDSISKNTGGIYYIDPQLVLQYVDVDTVSSPYTLTDQPSGPFDVGYRDLEIIEDGNTLVNDALVWGLALGSTGYVFGRIQDLPSIKKHGRWQVGLPTASLITQLAVDSVARSYVDGTPTSHRGGKNDRVSFTCVVFNQPLVVAQKVRTISAIEAFDDVYPIRRITTTFPTPHDTQMELALSWEPDIPWSFSQWAGVDIGKDSRPPPPPPPPSQPQPPPPTIDVCLGDNFDRVAAAVWGSAPSGRTWVVEGLNVTGYIGNGITSDLNTGAIYGTGVSDGGEMLAQPITFPLDMRVNVLAEGDAIGVPQSIRWGFEANSGSITVKLEVDHIARTTTLTMSDALNIISDQIAFVPIVPYQVAFSYADPILSVTIGGLLLTVNRTAATPATILTFTSGNRIRIGGAANRSTLLQEVDNLTICNNATPARWVFLDTFDVRTLCNDFDFGTADNDRAESRAWHMVGS